MDTSVFAQAHFRMEYHHTFTGLALTFIALSLARWLLKILIPPSDAVIKRLPGPPSTSWIYGNMRELMIPSEHGQHEFEWQRKYGLVYRIKGCFGSSRVMISDPHAIKYILADTSKFSRSPQQQQIVRLLIGDWTIFYVSGDDHRRIRTVMNPAFSAAGVRALPPLIRSTAAKLTRQWKEILSQPEGSVIDLSPYLNHATIDIVGEAILGVPFNTLENDDSEVARTHLNVVALASVRSSASVLLDGIMNYLPDIVLRLAMYVPSTAMRHLRRNKELTEEIATELIRVKEEAFRKGLETEKDLMSLLVNANASLNDVKKMSTTEMIHQVGGIMVAGQETSATTLGWTLYELAKRPAAQEKLRAEISDTYAVAYSRGDSELSYADLEGMSYLNSFIKEVLRVYAALPMSERVAAEDTVLPLSQPIITTTGERITELPVKKGQFLNVMIASYQRATSVWGHDADEFRAERWVQGECTKATALGPYAKLLSFLGGPRTCIGWRLAITEIQVVIIELVRNFAFAVPEGVQVRKRMAVTLTPVTGEGNGTQSLPLLVKVIE